MVDSTFYSKKLESLSLKDINKLLKLKIEIPNEIENKTITNVNNIYDAESDHLCFLFNYKYIKDLKKSNSRFCLVSNDIYSKVIENNSSSLFS